MRSKIHPYPTNITSRTTDTSPYQDIDIERELTKAIDSIEKEFVYKSEGEFTPIEDNPKLATGGARGRKDKYFAAKGYGEAISLLREKGIRGISSASEAVDHLGEELKSAYEILANYDAGEIQLSEEELQEVINEIAINKKTLGKLTSTHIVKKQDPLESFIEVTTGMLARYFLGNCSPKYRLAQTDENLPPVLTAKFLRNYQDVMSISGKADLSRSDIERHNLRGIEDVIAVSLYGGDFDWHLYNIGMILDDHGQNMAGRIDYGLSTAFKSKDFPSVELVRLSADDIITGIRPARKTAYASHSPTHPNNYPVHELLVDVCRTRGYEEEIYKNENFINSIKKITQKDFNKLERVIEATIDYQAKYQQPKIFNSFLDYQNVPSVERTANPVADIKKYLKATYQERHLQLQDLARNLEIELAFSKGLELSHLNQIIMPENESEENIHHNIRAALSYALLEGNEKMISQLEILASNRQVDLNQPVYKNYTIDKLFNKIEHAQLARTYMSEAGKSSLEKAKGLKVSLNFLLKQQILADKSLTPETKNLHLAILNGDQTKIVEAISQGAEINQISQISGMNALHLASYFNNPDAIDTLIASGATIEMPNSRGLSAIHIACLHHNFAATLNLTEEHDASLTNLLTTSKPSRSAIELAAGNPNSMFFAALGFDLNAYLEDGHTLLTKAAISGNKGQAISLIEIGAEVNKADKTGNTLMHYLAEFGNPEVFNQFILMGGNPTISNDHEKTAVDIAQEKGIDINRPDSKGLTPLIIAVKMKNYSLIKQLKNCPSINIDEPLPGGNTVLMQAVKMNNPKMVKALIKAGADVNIPDSNRGIAAIQYAAFNDREEIAIILAEAGAEVTPQMTRFLGRENPELLDKLEEIELIREQNSLAESSTTAGLTQATSSSEFKTPALTSSREESFKKSSDTFFTNVSNLTSKTTEKLAEAARECLEGDYEIAEWALANPSHPAEENLLKVIKEVQNTGLTPDKKTLLTLIAKSSAEDLQELGKHHSRLNQQRSSLDSYITPEGRATATPSPKYKRPSNKVR